MSDSTVREIRPGADLDPRAAAAAFLRGGLSRRGFLMRLAAAGVAAPAAAAVLADLEAPAGQAPGAGGRVLRNLTGGELTAEFLIDWEVPYVFGLGGSEEVGFLDALVDRPALQYLLALHEGSVLSMADGYARVSGRTAVVNLHSVAGAAYALGPMVNAYKDRTPLLVTVGRQSTGIRGQDAFLEAPNLHTLPRDYARWTWDVMDAGTIPEVLRRAAMIARMPPSGPTFVTFSKDLWERRAERAEIIPPERSSVEDAIVPARETIDTLAARLRAAEAPLLIAGEELARYGGVAELATLAELLGAAVMSDVPASHSPLGFPTRHPLYAGLFGMDEPPYAYDLFWSVGGTMFTLFNRPDEPLVPRDVYTVHASIEPTRIGRNYPVDLAVTGNPRVTLRALVQTLQSQPPAADAVSARKSHIEAQAAARRARLLEAATRVWNESPIAPERLALELNDRLERDAIVVTELATSDFEIWRYLDFDAVNGRRHVTSAGGCLGWGPGAALGAKIAAPHRQVALLIGDGSLQFGVQALWSAARYEIPVAVIVWNNVAYQANRRALHRYGGRAAATGQYVGCHLGAPEIEVVRIAAGYGVEGERVTRPETLPAALDRCLKTVTEGRPYLVDVAVQPRFEGASSTWHDEFSVAGLVRR